MAIYRREQIFMSTGGEEPSVSDTEADEMEEHLRGLGYLEERSLGYASRTTASSSWIIGVSELSEPPWAWTEATSPVRGKATSRVFTP